MVMNVVFSPRVFHGATTLSGSLPSYLHVDETTGKPQAVILWGKCDGRRYDMQTFSGNPTGRAEST